MKYIDYLLKYMEIKEIEGFQENENFINGFYYVIDNLNLFLDMTK